MPEVFNAKNDPSASGAVEDEAKNPVSDIGVVESAEFKKRHFHNPFRAYLYKPHWVNFETKHKDEEVLLLLRRHPITNVPWIIVVLIMALGPLLLDSFPIFAFLLPNFKIIALMAWYLIVFAYALENFLIWFFNVSIVTDRRMVDIDFHSLLYKEVSDAELDQIQDVTYKMGGAIRTVFNYGDVLVQTASEVPNFDFLAVPRPDDVVKVLQRLREHHGHKKL